MRQEACGMGQTPPQYEYYYWQQRWPLTELRQVESRPYASRPRVPWQTLSAKWHCQLMRYCPLATPPPPGGEPNPGACSHNQISSHQKASEQTAGPFSWYSITDAAGRNYLWVPAPAPVPAAPPPWWASSYRVASCKRSSKTKIARRTQLFLSPISLFFLSLSF